MLDIFVHKTSENCFLINLIDVTEPLCEYKRNFI